MSYVMNIDFPTEVTVEMTYQGQQIVNRVYYRWAGGLDPFANSLLWSLDFLVAWRELISLSNQELIVNRVLMREIVDAQFTSPDFDRAKWLYDPNKLQITLGNPAVDRGGVAPAVGPILQSYDAARLHLSPAGIVPRYFKGNYLRLLICTETTNAPTNSWSAGFKTALETAAETWRSDPIHGVIPPAGSGWIPAIGSMMYWLRVVKPGGGAGIVDSFRNVAGVQLAPAVGTQVTRRLKPDGTIRGS